MHRVKRLRHIRYVKTNNSTCPFAGSCQLLSIGTRNLLRNCASAVPPPNSFPPYYLLSSHGTPSRVKSFTRGWKVFPLCDIVTCQVLSDSASNYSTVCTICTINRDSKWIRGTPITMYSSHIDRNDWNSLKIYLINWSILVIFAEDISLGRIHAKYHFRFQSGSNCVTSYIHRDLLFCTCFPIIVPHL